MIPSKTTVNTPPKPIGPTIRPNATVATKRPTNAMASAAIRFAQAVVVREKPCRAAVTRGIRAFASSKRATTRWTRESAVISSLERGERRIRGPPGQLVLGNSLGAGDVAATLLDLAAERVDRLLHVAERLDLEAVDRVHRIVDVLERALKGLERNGRGRGLLVDLGRLALEQFAGRFDHVGRRGVERGDLLQHQPLVGQRLGDGDSGPQRRDG